MLIGIFYMKTGKATPVSRVTNVMLVGFESGSTIVGKVKGYEVLKGTVISAKTGLK